MELRQSGPALWTEMAEAFEERNFLRKLGMTRSDVERVFGAVDWRQILAPFTPLRTRVSCAAALESFRPLLLSLAPEPPEGWLRYAYQVALSLLYPAADHSHTSAQWDGALCFLQFLQVLLRSEGRLCPLTPGWILPFVPRRSSATAVWRKNITSFWPGFRESTSTSCCG